MDRSGITSAAQNAVFGGSAPAWLALLLGPSLALLFGVAPSASPSKPPTVGGASGHKDEVAAAPAPNPAEPSAYCMQRFFEPVVAAAGSANPGPSKAWSGHAKQADAGVDFELRERVGDGANLKWSERLALARATLTTLVQSTLPSAAELEIGTMIVTLPDPRDSGLGYLFDSQLQAVRLGIEAGFVGDDEPRYYRDRSWLPWDDRGVSEGQRSQSQGCRTEVPGVIVFRTNDLERPKLLLLLLVGETPTAGVHPRAMREAIVAADQLRTEPVAGCRDQPSPGRCECCLKVLGPSFSGSALSLRRALAPSTMKRAVRIISGTATGPDLPALLNREHAPSISFQATTIPEHALECSFLHFVKQLGASEKHEDGNDLLRGVGILQESGTGFGTSLTEVGADEKRDTSSGCRLKAELQLGFPFHVSEIRDAYEQLEQQSDPGIVREMARRTALEISLGGQRGTDIETPTSSITKFAQDLALANVLGEISREGIRWLGIRATNTADAIFLARKIRDVAPDVQLAFFTADALLMHPEYQHDLLGSLVVSGYPFLGADDFSPRGRRVAPDGDTETLRHAHAPFENAGSLGTFNAALALRGAPSAGLHEYVFAPLPHPEPKPLPIWIAALSSSGFVPLRLRPAVDCAGTIYHGSPPAELCALVKAGAEEAVLAAAWTKFADMSAFDLKVDGDVTPPRLWHFVFALLVIVIVVDMVRQRRALHVMGLDSKTSFEASANDRQLDLDLAATSWLFYAMWRRITLFVFMLYMLCLHIIAFATYVRWEGIDYVLVIGGGVALVLCAACLVWIWRGGLRYLRCFLRLRSLQKSIKRTPHRIQEHTDVPSPALDWVTAKLSVGGRWLGFQEPSDRDTTIHVSYAQLRAASWVCGITAAGFFALLCAHIVVSTDFEAFPKWSRPALTLFVLRSLPLLNGVSPAAPILLCLAAVYAWTVGRCARLQLVRGLSRMSPDDGVLDCVSTPIRMIFLPNHASKVPRDGGFTRQERRLVNALVRPSGPAYLCMLLAIGAVPVVLFLLKPPSTLEHRVGTALLFTGLAICAVLVGSMLVQLFRYWWALDLVLKRLMSHALGPAFQRVQAFMREPVDAQVSRVPNDLLRVVGCAQAFETLVLLDRPRAIESKLVIRAEDGADTDTEITFASLEQCGAGMADKTEQTLAASVERKYRAAAEVECKLCASLIETSALLVRILMAARQKRLVGYDGANKATRLISTFPPPSNEARKQEQKKSGGPPKRENEEERAEAEQTEYPAAGWFIRVESFVVTVVTMLLNRHVRQFRHFLYTSTSCALLLLTAVASYPFEPHRTLLTCIWILMSAVVFSCLYVFVQLDRDPLLSFIAGTPDMAGRVTWNAALVFRLILWVVIPLVSVLAAQYPAIANKLAASIEPIARALR